MPVRLLIDGGLGRRELSLPEGTSVVGRGPVGNLVRLEERNVSRRHACFQVATGGVTVEDLGSRNGTYVNGERLQGRRRLRPGDRVRVGDFELLLEDGAGEPPRPAETSGERSLPPPLPNRYGAMTPRPAALARPPPRRSLLRRVVEAASRAVEALAALARRR